ASDLAVFREFAADIPEYADPLDAHRWLALIKEYSKPESDRRRAQLARLEGFSLPTWKQHFAQLELLLERIDDDYRIGH
ncbi:MAG: glycosyltransferase family 1 protein, partial [Betaproteobacteria bacterium]